MKLAILNKAVREKMESDRIERQYQDSKDLVAYLMGKEEISFATYIDSVYKKVLVLSAASYFESVISKCILDYATKASGPDKRIVTLIENKVIERQYHTLFDWKAKNTNTFFTSSDGWIFATFVEKLCFAPPVTPPQITTAASEKIPITA